MMLYLWLHYISKYTLMFSVYLILLTIGLTFIGANELVFILITAIYIALIKFKVISFSSSWLERANKK